MGSSYASCRKNRDFDSGASCHMTCFDHWMYMLEQCSIRYRWRTLDLSIDSDVLKVEVKGVRYVAIGVTGVGTYCRVFEVSSCSGYKYFLRFLI